MTPRSALLVGAGAMGRTWLGTLGNHPGVTVTGVVDVVDASAQSAIEERSLDAKAFTDVAAAIDATRPDILIDVTVPEAHYEVNAAGLRAGVPVLTEKPATATIAESLRLAALSEITGVPLVTSQSRRYSVGMTAFRATLERLGGAEQLAAQFFQSPRFGGFRDVMVHPLLGDMVIHQFDAARALLGVEPATVYCEDFNPSWSWYAGDASATALFAFSNGARFTFDGSWCADGLETSWNADWRGVAPAGTATWDGELLVRSQERGADAVDQVLEADEREGLDASLDEFLGFLDGAALASGLIADNVWSLAMVEGALTSAERGARVSFDELFTAAHAEAMAGADADIAARLREWTDPWPPRVS